MSGAAAKTCAVPGCTAPGCFGRRKIIGDWRKGYDWWCGAHRPVVPDATARRSEPLPSAAPSKGQGRLL